MWYVVKTTNAKEDVAIKGCRNAISYEIANILLPFMGGENKLIKVGLEVPKRLTTAEYQKMKEEIVKNH